MDWISEASASADQAGWVLDMVFGHRKLQLVAFSIGADFCHTTVFLFLKHNKISCGKNDGFEWMLFRPNASLGSTSA
ncbi:MAG: hypothetical protein HQL54_12965 [Magnetococcales bacterium]|nr:hypothetical protein [Magnetococcales bacterium]